MKHLLGCVLLLGVPSFAQSSPAHDVQSTLLALKNSNIPREVLSNRLVDQMMALAKHNQSPARSSVQRFSEDLTTALMGRDITTIRAESLQKSIADLLHGKGSTFVPASALRDTLMHCGVEDSTVQQIVQRFIDIGREVRGPDDLPVMKMK